MTCYCRKAGQYIGRRGQATFTTAWLIYAMRHRYDGAFRAASQSNKKNYLMSTVLYPGTFNPIHNGHADLVERAAALFDSVVLGIATSPQKSPSVLGLRVELAREVLSHIDNVEVKGFNTLTVDFAREVGATVILKGIRTVTDFDYEFQMLNMNRALDADIETVFLAPSEENSYISSSLVRQINGYGGDITQFVHPAVAEALKAGKID